MIHAEVNIHQDLLKAVIRAITIADHGLAMSPVMYHDLGRIQAVRIETGVTALHALRLITRVPHKQNRANPIVPIALIADQDLLAAVIIAPPIDPGVIVLILQGATTHVVDTVAEEVAVVQGPPIVLRAGRDHQVAAEVLLQEGAEDKVILYRNN